MLSLKAMKRAVFEILVDNGRTEAQAEEAVAYMSTRDLREFLLDSREDLSPSDLPKSYED